MVALAAVSAVKVVLDEAAGDEVEGTVLLHAQSSERYSVGSVESLVATLPDAPPFIYQLTPSVRSRPPS